MKIFVNGEERDAAGALDVAQLVIALGLPAQATLVEHNGVALRRTEWDGRALGEGDRLEIIRIVAGG
jgi:sulfur carrier protein